MRKGRSSKEGLKPSIGLIDAKPDVRIEQSIDNLRNLLYKFLTRPSHDLQAYHKLPCKLDLPCNLMHTMQMPPIPLQFLLLHQQMGVKLTSQEVRSIPEFLTDVTVCLEFLEFVERVDVHYFLELGQNGVYLFCVLVGVED